MFSLSCLLAKSTLTLVAVLLWLHVLECILESFRSLAIRFSDAEHLLWIPVFSIAEQGPSQHGDLASQCDSGLFLACLLLAADAVVNFFGPWVVAERCPSAFDENRTGQWIASFGNTAIAVCFTRLVLARD